ncbi:hypothetical protein [Paraburkholderia sp. MM5482-R1]|uniref:hypothetical protein n=1 Tax=unclassified Paraburkholderia TaxID=2615204 RepID=UPI003D1F19FE
MRATRSHGLRRHPHGNADPRSIDYDQTACDRYDEAARRYDAARHRFPFDLANVIRPELDKPAFTVPDATPVHRHPRTDFGALRGSLRV